MTATTLTLTIAGSTYPILHGSFKLSTKIDETSELDVTVIDVNSAWAFQKGQQVSLSDTSQGTLFTGFVNTSQINKVPGSNTARYHQLVCIDNHFIALKRTSNRVYNGQYAGVIVADMVNDVLSAEGVTANYAIRDDNTRIDFAQGTLSGTQATNNLGGDLELQSAGSQTTILENTGSIFGAGTLVNCQTSGNTLIPTPTPTIKLVGTESLTGDNNAYIYIKILSSGSISIISGRYLAYDIFMLSSCPEMKAGVDIIFTDGTTLRDTATAYPGTDAQSIPPHPNKDLAGYADGKWYHRKILLDSVAGKTISHVDVVIEGDKGGTYTVYIKNIYEVDVNDSVVNTFFNGTFNINPPQQMQNSGYNNIAISVVDTYDCYSPSYRISPSYSIDAAKIVRDSFITWQSTLPKGTNVLLEYSIDGGNSYITCTNNAALPGFLAGLSIAGFSIQFRQTFQQTSDASPETPPVLSLMEVVINPSYQATKSDIAINATTTAQWNAGTLTNTQVNNGVLSLLGAVRNWSGADMSNMTIFGAKGSGPGPTTLNQHVNYKVFWIQMAISTEGRSRLDFLGNWQDFILEVDVLFDVNYGINGVVYRTTGWSNWDADYAYAVQAIQGNPGTISLQRGSNTSAGSDGTRTQVAIANVPTGSGGWHRLKVLVVGSNHKLYVDDILYINVTDATYTAAGNLGLRTSNVSASQGYQGQYNNLGVTVSGLSGTWLSPVQSLTAAGTYGNSVVTWEDVSIGSQSTSILVESTTNGGSTWQTVTNGGPITSLTPGQSLSGVNLQIRVTLSTNNASCMPQIKYLVVRVLGQFSSTGTRVAPVLPLSPALVCGAATANWNAITPPNTTFTLETSPDNVTYSGIFGPTGVVIAGLTTQPLPMVDTFAIDDSPSYTHLQRTGGSAGTWVWDTTNSRVSVSGGTNDMQLYSGVWFNTGYKAKKRIIIDHTKVMGGANLTNFPVLISLVDPDLVIPSGYVQNANGYDIIFVNATETTQLSHEIERYNPFTGEIQMWVKIPTLSYTADTVIWMYFCNSSISTTQENVTSVWDANFKAVWHMDASTGSNQPDSTSNALTLTQHNSPVQTLGQSDGALAFNGLTQYFDIAHGSVADITGDKTIEMLFNAASFALDTSGAGPRLIINNIDNTNVYQFALTDGGVISFAVNDATGQHCVSSQTWNTDTWYYLAGTYVASTHTVTLYINGVSTNTGSTSLALGNVGVNLARRTDAVGYFLGSEGESRISNNVRSPGWIATTSNTIMSPDTFLAVGSLTFQPTTSSKDIDLIVDSDQTDCAGLFWRETSAGNFYELDVFDSASVAGSTNTLKLYKVVSNVKTQIGSNTSIVFNRGTVYRIRVTMVGTTITIYFDGKSVLSATDSALAGPGSAGLIEVSGSARFYNFRFQPLGQSLSGVNLYSRVTLASTDPTVTPQLNELTLAVLHPNITIGARIPTASYLFTYISANMDDLAKKSNAYWVIDKSLNMIFADYQAVPAPWVLTNKDLLVSGLHTVNNGDLYRNRQNITGVVAVGIATEYKVGDGTTRSWTLGGTLISAPIIFLNGQLQTVGIKGVDTGKNFYWTPNSASVDQDPSGVILQQTDLLYFPSYEYQYKTTVTLDNSGEYPGTISQNQFAALSGGTGIVEETTDVSDQNLDLDAAKALARSLLQRYGTIGTQMQFSTLRSGLAIGQSLVIFNPETNMNDITALITAIDMTQTTILDPATNTPTQLYWYEVTVETAANAGSWAKLLASSIN